MPLAERMILALEAGQAKGGDRRWGNLQSAAIKVADPNDPGRGDDHITLAIEVGEHAEPVGEMKRIYYTTQRRLGYRTFSRIEGPDVIELKRMLHAVGYWRPTLAAFPDAPTVNAQRNQELRKNNPAEFEKAQTESRRLATEYQPRLRGSTTRRRSRRSTNSARTRSLAYAGNPPGLVDERLVDRAASGVPGEEEGQALSADGRDRHRAAVRPAARRARRHCCRRSRPSSGCCPPSPAAGACATSRLICWTRDAAEGGHLSRRPLPAAGRADCVGRGI